MNLATDFNHRRRSVLLALLSIVIFIPSVLGNPSMASWLPEWTMGVAALAALLGVLVMYWRSGALRSRSLFGFVATLCIAGVIGWLLAHA